MVSTKNPDEIMAEYLLKGGKMLAKTCPVCYSPLFEYKGETFCVVCRERDMHEHPPVQTKATAAKSEQSTNPPIPATGISAPSSVQAPGGLEDEFSQTLRFLLQQVREERDSKRILNLMHAVKEGAHAYTLLLYGYGRRDNS